MPSTPPIRHPLSREAITHFGVSPALVAQPLNPAATRWIWPDKKTAVARSPRSARRS